MIFTHGSEFDHVQTARENNQFDGNQLEKNEQSTHWTVRCPQPSFHY